MRGAYTWPPIISRRYRPRASSFNHTTTEKSTTKAKKSDEKEHLQDCEIYCRAIQDGGAAGVPAGSVYGRRA